MPVKKVDTNEDGQVDKAEVEAMAHGFATQIGQLEARIADLEDRMPRVEDAVRLRLKRGN